jgi:NADPH:quinone reductase-like Zn-dependent oxidoreductase
MAVLGNLAAPGERFADLSALEQAVADGMAAPEIVLLAAEHGPAHDGTPAANTAADTSLAQAARHATEDMLRVLQRWLASEQLAGARLVVVTTNAVAAGDQLAFDLAQAPLWGLVRSAQSEHPGRFLLVDTDGGAEPDWAAIAGAGEPQVAVRGGILLAPRLSRAAEPPAGRAWRLGSERKGSLEALEMLPSQGERPLGVGEVRVGVRAAGLNFRDVLIALGTYPGDAPLGSEGAGVVLEVGSDVTDLAPGDRVFGLMPDAFGPVSVTDRRTVAPIPVNLSFVQAAALPVVYLTAYYGLVDLAGVQPGERLLVHAAAGGVGMAAVQLARSWGLEVFATASEAKWAAVRDLGVPGERIASSRDLGFRDTFLAATDGAGVDVILNALAGEFIDASLDLLPRGGRFIEMGKADLRDPQVIAGERAGVRYRSYDVMEAGLDRVQEMLVEIASLFERGALDHAPIRTWPVQQGASAFRFLREGRNTGKVVLTVPAPFGAEGTVLITGGTSGLGALFAKHLAARCGVKRLLLVSRRGRAADGVTELLAELAELGADAQVAACDVADADQLASLLAGLEQPLSGVIHSAGVLDDGVIESLTPQQLDRVFRPKVDAALNLHELTKDMDLSAFVLFSSLAALVGSPGQGNYAAANAFLDGLVAKRQASGLVGSSLAWGLWADATGMTGEIGEAELARMDRMGVGGISNELGVELFDSAQRLGMAIMVPALLNQVTLRAQAQAGMLAPLMRGLVRVSARQAQSAGGSLADRLATARQQDWERITLDLVRAQVAAVLGHASFEAVDPNRTFKELGFDSLAAVEVRNRLSQVTGLRLLTTLVFDHPSPLAVARYLITAALPDSAPDEPARSSEEAELRDLLTSIPIAQLRRAGLLDALLALAQGEPVDAAATSDGPALIDDMDLAALIRMAQEDTAS